jgi:hypothetical protein
VEPIDITKASVRQVLAPVLRTGLFLKAYRKTEVDSGPSGGFNSWGDQRLFQHVNSGGLKTCKFVKILRSVFMIRILLC